MNSEKSHVFFMVTIILGVLPGSASEVNIKRF